MSGTVRLASILFLVLTMETSSNGRVYHQVLEALATEAFDKQAFSLKIPQGLASLNRLGLLLHHFRRRPSQVRERKNVYIHPVATSDCPIEIARLRASGAPPLLPVARGRP